ncbi:YdcF family protein [Carnobacterium pleistocenium]|uniref:YdcF family protein n=1 Tax=Carnobacterium pleistocenium TaxID=181073 RepID=UPI0005593D0C|nr:YdcF family protein [Carnobacterium pleistocenium]
MKKRRMFILIVVILFVSLIIGVSYPIIITNLIVNEEPVLSDVIIVPEGQAYVRAYRASELLHEGYSESEKIIVSPIDKANEQIYLDFDVEETQIIPEMEATSTYENAVNTLEMMEENGFDSAVIVSSDYHMLRTKLIYERTNRDYGYELTYVAAYQLVNGEFVPWNDAGEDLQYVAKREFWNYWGYLLGLYHFFNL